MCNSHKQEGPEPCQETKISESKAENTAPSRTTITQGGQTGFRVVHEVQSLFLYYLRYYFPQEQLLLPLPVERLLYRESLLVSLPRL